MIRTLFAVLVLAFATSCAAAPPPPSSSPPAEHTTRGLSHPESVLLAGDTVYVSNIGGALEPLAKDGDGFVSELSRDGTIRALRAFAPLDAPKGLAVLGGLLFVADVDRVVAFDTTTHARAFDVPSPSRGATLLNDLVVAKDRSVLVTDTLAGALYRLDLAARTLVPLADGMAGANGVAFDATNHRAIVACIGEGFRGGDLYAVPLDGAPKERIGAAHGLFDGIAVRHDGAIVVSDWIAIAPPHDGALVAIDRAGSIVRTIALAGMHGPADFAYDAATETLWIPRTLDGAVTAIGLR